ncbi:MAG: Na/H antiporter [Chlorobi bacterium OLB6]|nr:MAG: Na/H antiporter [Chlorobi bacterium OLB6]
MPLLTSLLMLIVVARIFGHIAVRLKQPAIVGEMVAGVLLGPSVLGLVTASPALSGISELAVFLVVLSAGLEMNFNDVVKAFKGKGSIIGLFGFLIPLILGILVGLVFGLDVNKTVFLGLCISITALPVAVGILQSFGILNSRIGKYSIATAILNDVFALMILGVLLSLPEQRSFEAVGISIALTVWKLVVLGAVILGFNWVLEKLVQWGVHVERFPEKLVQWLGNDALFGLVVLFVLVFGSASEMLGFHFVVGAFFGALLIDRKFFLAERYHVLDSTLRSVSDGFLAPIFFAYLGLEFNIFWRQLCFVCSCCAHRFNCVKDDSRVAWRQNHRNVQNRFNGNSYHSKRTWCDGVGYCQYRLREGSDWSGIILDACPYGSRVNTYYPGAVPQVRNATSGKRKRTAAGACRWLRAT